MEIRIYDRSLNYLGVVENQTSLLWRRRYHEPGEFELHAPITAENLRLLKPGNIVTRRVKSLNICNTEAGIISDIINEDSKLKNEMARRGGFMPIYFNRRHIQGTINFNGLTEIAMRQLLTNVKPIPLVRLGNLQGFTERVEFQVTYKNLLVYLTKLSRSSGLGFRLRPDFVNKELIFEAYKGVERTISQGINSRVIFSKQYENLNNAIYRYNDQLYKTFAIIGGEGEGADRMHVTIGGGEGLDLRETYIDARDLQSEGLTPAEYRAKLIQRGYEKLAECAINESLEFEADANINFIYGKHYDLGDIASARLPAWGIELNMRITEITEVYQDGGMFVSPTFGNPLPETIDWGRD